MDKRTTPGKYVPSGEKRSTFKCGTCDFMADYCTWQAHDGSKGHWCPKCKDKNVKSAVTEHEVDVLKYVKGTNEIKCCGRWMQCNSFTNTCDQCGKDYNGAGQELAPRSQWGEETGETASDIMMGGDYEW